MKNIVLASASIRRSRILAECGIEHTVSISRIDEKMSGDAVEKLVVWNAEMKAEAANTDGGEAVIIGADTLVVHGEEMIGKPDGEESARNMLKKFSGQEIEVYTGVCVIDTASGKKASGYDKSAISVRVISDGEIEKYFRLLGPYDKAGGFSIEGAGSLIFDNIRGSYFNILGLPMMKMAELFKEAGLDILDHIEAGERNKAERTRCEKYK